MKGSSWNKVFAFSAPSAVSTSRSMRSWQNVPLTIGESARVMSTLAPSNEGRRFTAEFTSGTIPGESTCVTSTLARANDGRRFAAEETPGADSFDGVQGLSADNDSWLSTIVENCRESAVLFDKSINPGNC